MLTAAQRDYMDAVLKGQSPPVQPIPSPAVEVSKTLKLSSVVLVHEYAQTCA